MNHFQEYQNLNALLLQYIMSGQSETTKAEAVRDLMDVHWKYMNEEEHTLSRKINETRLS